MSVASMYNPGSPLIGSGSNTYYMAPTGGQNVTPGVDTVEGNQQLTVRLAGTFSDFGVYIGNPVLGPSTCFFRVNGANGNQAISLINHASGFFAASAGLKDTVNAGDEVCCSFTTGSGTSASILASLVNFLDANTSNTTVIAGSGVFTTTLNGTTRYSSFNGNPTFNATEANMATAIRRSATFQYLFVNVSNNTYAAAITINSRKNSAAGNMSVSITAATTGNFEDTTNSDSVANADTWDYQFVFPSGTGKTINMFYAATYTVSNSNYSILTAGGTGGNFFASTNQFCPVSGTAGSNNSISPYNDIQGNFLTSNCRVLITANGITATSTFNLVVNSVAVNQTMSVGSSATGLFEDTTNSDAILSQTAMVKCTPGGSGSNMSYAFVALESQGPMLFTDPPTVLVPQLVIY